MNQAHDFCGSDFFRDDYDYQDFRDYHDYRDYWSLALKLRQLKLDKKEASFSLIFRRFRAAGLVSADHIVAARIYNRALYAVLAPLGGRYCVKTSLEYVYT